MISKCYARAFQWPEWQLWQEMEIRKEEVSHENKYKNENIVKVTHADNRIARSRAPALTRGKYMRDRCKHTWVKVYNFLFSQPIIWHSVNINHMTIIQINQDIFHPPSSDADFLDGIVVPPCHSVVTLDRVFSYFLLACQNIILPSCFFLSPVRLTWDAQA